MGGGGVGGSHAMSCPAGSANFYIWLVYNSTIKTHSL